MGEPTKFVASADNLKNVDFAGKSDPYFKIYVGENYIYRSETLENDLHPIWKEASFFAPEGTTSVILKVFDDDAGKDDLLAQQEVPYPLEFKTYDLGDGHGSFTVQSMDEMKSSIQGLFDGCEDFKIFQKVKKLFQEK